jgi:hypothetical protein
MTTQSSRFHPLRLGTAGGQLGMRRASRILRLKRCEAASIDLGQCGLIYFLINMLLTG